MALPLLALIALASAGAITTGLRKPAPKSTQKSVPGLDTLRLNKSRISSMNMQNVTPPSQTKPQTPAVPAIPATPPQVGTDPYAPYANSRQFKNKSNVAVDSALMRTVVDLAKQYQVDPRLAGAVAIQESNWNPAAVGGTQPPGYGLYQLTPGVNKGRWDEKRLLEAAYNTEEAMKMLQEGLADADKLGFTGDTRLRHTLRRYNGGPQYWANVPGWGGRTRNQNSKAYADAVMSWYNQ